MFGATVTVALLVSVLIALLLPPRLPKPAARTHPSISPYNFDRSHQPLGLWANEVDRQQPLHEFGAQHLHPVGKQKAALKLPGGDAPMQIFTRLVLLLPATDRKLVLLDRNLDLVL